MAGCCAFCGALVDPTAAPGSLPGTIVCHVCGREIDAPGQGPTTAPPPPSPLAAPAVGPSGPGPCQGPAPAWEGQGPLWRRLARTTSQMLFHPGQTLATPPPPGYAGPLGYGLILGTFGMAMQGLWGRLQGEALWGSSAGLWLLALAPLVVLAALFVGSWILHFGLWMVGGDRRGLAATFRYCAYSQATGVFYLLPLIGPLLGGVWSLVILLVGLARAHAIAKRQVFSALLVIMCLLGVLAGVVVAGFSALKLGQMTGPRF